MKFIMKKKFLAIAFLLIGGSVMLASFDQADAATGGISVTVALDDEPVAEVLVGVSTSAENRENSTYVSEKETNAQGVVNFTGLAAGTYYLDAYISNDENDYWAEADVTVTDGVVEISLALEIEE
jgi:hypothetical protein